MSQDQTRREDQPPRSTEEERKQEPIKYGTVFDISGELADKPIAPGDASMMQTAEATVLGKLPPCGAGAAMQAAANINVVAGVVGSTDVSDVAGKHGVMVTETDLPGRRIITESVAGQVVGQYLQAAPASQTTVTDAAGGQARHASGGAPSALLTIGEALEAVLQTCGDKPVEISDSAAIQCAEFLLTGHAAVTPSGLTATAQSAAAYNSGIIGDEAKVKLRDILTGTQGAAGKLPGDRTVQREDAEAAAQAELQNSQNMNINPGGIAASMAAAARLNEKEAQST